MCVCARVCGNEDWLQALIYSTTELHSAFYEAWKHSYLTINVHEAPVSYPCPLQWHGKDSRPGLLPFPGSELTRHLSRVPVLQDRYPFYFFEQALQVWTLGPVSHTQSRFSHVLLCHFEAHQMMVALKVPFSQCQFRHVTLIVPFLIHIP